jgi:hypothetical protein
MASHETDDGSGVDRGRLDRVERRFWRDIWEAVPAGVAAEHGIEVREFGPLQATIAAALPEAGMLNMILGATEPGAVDGGHLGGATEWARSRGVTPYVPVTPGLAESDGAETWLYAHGFGRGRAWVKFLRDPHPPRFACPGGVEVIELGGRDDAPFGMIAATGFGLPAWAAAFFSRLPELNRWRCYVARVDGTAQACAAMLLHGGVAEFGIAATLEPSRGRGCQLALLHRRIVDAAVAGCDTLLIETGERVPGHPSPSHRNILRAGFKEAYLRPNWRPRPAAGPAA